MMARRGAHYEEAEAHTLNNAGDQKSSGNHRRIKTQRAKGRRKVSVRPQCCQLAYSSSVIPLTSYMSPSPEGIIKDVNCRWFSENNFHRSKKYLPLNRCEGFVKSGLIDSDLDGK